eukprot:PITA_05974
MAGRWILRIGEVGDIKIEDLGWHEFKRIFQEKYLSERYYDSKAKEFYELKMRSMIDEKYVTKFLELLRNVPYLKDDKAKVQHFVSSFPLAFRDQIEYDEPRSLEEFFGNLKHFNEQSKPQDNKQAYHQASIIEMDDKLYDQVVSILIEPGSNYSYGNPDLVDKCHLNKEVHTESWLVQLDVGTKKRVHHWVRACAFELNGMSTSAHLNVLPLGLYNMLMGMDWLYPHRTKVDFYDKAIEFLDENGELRILQGKREATSVRMVTAMQEKCSRRKGCVLFVVHISSDKGKEVEDVDVLRRYPVLQQFQDVFPAKISESPPHREVEFSVELVSGATPTSKAPYKMSTPELVELNFQLKEMIDKGYIRPILSP